MKFLCLNYGGEDNWKNLSQQEQDALLAQEELLADSGNFQAAVQTTVVTVTNWGGNVRTTRESFSKPWLPLTGFSVIEARSLDEVIKIVSDSPCARARGAIEIRPIWDFSKAAQQNAA